MQSAWESGLSTSTGVPSICGLDGNIEAEEAAAILLAFDDACELCEQSGTLLEMKPNPFDTVSQI